MKSQSQRIHDPTAVEAELITPLSGPSYGPFDKARRSWHRKPLPAILADAIANNQALLARLERGAYCPDLEGKPHYTEIFNALFALTREQLAALETFRAIDWRERV